MLVGDTVKKIYLIGFRGTGFNLLEYAGEPALLQAGHVGFAFEDDPNFILGFHPTLEAIERAGGEEEAIEWLKENEPLDGALQSDYEIFFRAHELHINGARTEVWQLTIEVDIAEYDRVREQAIRWYTESTIFTYAFPKGGSLPELDRDNCATFPRRLLLPLPEPTGQLSRYIAELEKIGTPWKPEGG
jgi:hypothetical protein